MGRCTLGYCIVMLAMSTSSGIVPQVVELRSRNGGVTMDYATLTSSSIVTVSAGRKACTSSCMRS